MTPDLALNVIVTVMNERAGKSGLLKIESQVRDFPVPVPPHFNTC